MQRLIALSGAAFWTDEERENDGENEASPAGGSEEDQQPNMDPKCHPSPARSVDGG